MKIDYRILSITTPFYSLHNQNLQYAIVLNGTGHLSSDSFSTDINPHDLLELPGNGDGQLSISSSGMTLGILEFSDYVSYNSMYRSISAQHTEYIRKTFFYALDIKGLNSHIFSEVYASIDNIMFQLIVSLGFTNHENTPAVMNVIKDIRDNFRNPEYNVNDSIRKTGYSNSHFRKIFKESTAVSPIAFLNNIRLDCAKTIAKEEPELTVKEIALRCGFNDPYYFSRMFKQREGISPKQYVKSTLT